MRAHFQISLLSFLTFGLAACGAGGSEPSEAQMRDAMLYAMNHPPGIKVSDPITIRFFKKEACETKPTAQGFHCTFDVQVASANLGASMYNNISMGDFYIDKEIGKWEHAPAILTAPPGLRVFFVSTPSGESITNPARHFHCALAAT